MVTKMTIVKNTGSIGSFVIRTDTVISYILKYDSLLRIMSEEQG